MNNKNALPKRGRDEYEKYSNVIRVATRMVELMPQPLQRAALNFNKSSDAKLSRLVRMCGLNALSIRCGDLVDIRNQVDIFGVDNIEIGSRVSVHSKCYIDGTGGLYIGNDVSIAHHSTIMSTTHTWGDEVSMIRDHPLENRPTRINDNVWIGAGCRILAGVEIHSRSIVAAGSVVTKDVPSGTIVAGVPARVIKTI